MRVQPAGRRNGADVTVRLWPDKGCPQSVRAAFWAVSVEQRRTSPLLRLGRARQQLLDLDRDLVAAEDDRALGHRQVVGEDIDLVFFGRIELDDSAAAEPEHLVDRHRAGAENDGDVDGNLIECRQRAPHADFGAKLYAPIFCRLLVWPWHG